MVREAKQPKRVHACPHCLNKFSKKCSRDAHARAVHEKWRDMVSHCQTVHERRRDHKCPHCSSRFGKANNTV